MLNIQLCETERIREADGNYQTERRDAQACGGEWRPFAHHGSLAEAVSEVAEREIFTLPNDDLRQFARDADAVIAKYKQIYALGLEFPAAKFTQLGNL